MTLVEKLVRCSSVSGQEAEAVELLVEEMSTRGFRAYRDGAGNGVGVAGNGAVSVYLVGHIDTVSGEIPVRLQDGNLYGRGSVDAKGALAAFVEAASEFVDSQGLTVSVVGCVREETDSVGAKHLLTTLEPPDYIVIGEPSGWEGITLGYKGSLTVDFQLELPRFHHGAQERTAAEEAVAFYDALCGAYPERGARFGSLAIRLTDLNTSSLGTHEAVRMGINVRTPLEFDFDDFGATVADLSGQASISVNGFVPAVVSDKRNLLVRSFPAAIRGQAGTPCFKYKTGTSDMNILVSRGGGLSAWGCPIVAYGPGDSLLDHAPEEHL